MTEESIKKKRIQNVVYLYYSKPEIQKAIFEFCKERETIPQYFEGFGKRPDGLQYIGDIFELVKKGATSFHCSEELWEDALRISTGMSEEEFNNLRVGWDLLIDIDCKYFDYARLAAQAVIETLRRFGVENVGVKFSGSKGFHIIVPWKAFPKEINGISTAKLFPQLPRTLIEFIRNYSEKVFKELLPGDFYSQFQNAKIKKGIKCKKCNELVDIYEQIELYCNFCRQGEIKKIPKEFIRENYFCPECRRKLNQKNSKETYECKQCQINSNKNPENFSSTEEIDLFDLMGLDFILISPRHLFRTPYSVDFDEPIFIKKGEDIEVVKIGKFINKFFKKDSKLQIENVSNLNYKTISFNLKNNKTRFSKVTKVIRHEINEKLFQIKLESGREIKATSGHSLFILKNGKIQAIKGNEIKTGDYLVSPRKISSIEDVKKEIILSDEFIKKDFINKKKHIFLCDFDKNVFDKIYKLNVPKRKKINFYNWKACNILPLDVYSILIQKYPQLKNKFKDANLKMSHHGGKAFKIQNKLKINKKLMRLLGYYISEGCCDKKRDRIYFSFGAHEKELIKDCINILKILKLKPNIRKPHKTAVQIEINSNMLKLILKELFNCGINARNKRVPSLIWQVDDILKKEFIHSYIDGDGHLEKKWAKIIISTASKKLQEDLCFLFASIGIGYSLSTRHVTRWAKSNKEQHVFIVQGKKDIEKLGFKSNSKRIKESLTNKFPIKELGLEESILKSKWKNQYLNKKIISRSKNFIKQLNPTNEILSLINGDASFIKVKEIKEIKSKNKYVYDLSIKNDENFVGGNCILLHNSLHEKTGLSSVVLTQEELKDFEPKQASPLNVRVRNFSPESKEGEAEELIVEALDWAKNKEIGEGKSQEKISGKYANFKPVKIKELKEDQFPPCIKNILKGLEDGKKRGLFVLINIFRSIGMEKQEMEKKIYSWNEKNKPPLKKGYIEGQLKWNYNQKPKLPPNCKKFYQDIGVCAPGNLCLKIKNPLNYLIRKNFAQGKKNTIKKS